MQLEFVENILFLVLLLLLLSSFVTTEILTAGYRKFEMQRLRIAELRVAIDPECSRQYNSRPCCPEVSAA